MDIACLQSSEGQHAATRRVHAKEGFPASGALSPLPGCPQPVSDWHRFGEPMRMSDWKDPPPPPAPIPAIAARPRMLQAPSQPPSPVPS